jgi:membrane-associated phospholipid phosphatase
MADMAEPSKELDLLRDHRRAMLYGFLLLAAMAAIFIGVGKHPGQPGTDTTWPWIGNFDGDVYRSIQGHRNALFTFIAKVLNFLGTGLFTIPLRILVAVWLIFRKRWRSFSGWVLTWAAVEIVMQIAKAWYDRSRPPLALVETHGPSFPSGHAGATASIVVALVLVAMRAGPHRRKWEIVAALAAFTMALSRVYLNAHWFSDVVAGTLLGAGVALASFAIVTEVRDLTVRRRARTAATIPNT